MASKKGWNGKGWRDLRGAARELKHVSTEYSLRRPLCFFSIFRLVPTEDLMYSPTVAGTCVLTLATLHISSQEAIGVQHAYFGTRPRR